MTIQELITEILDNFADPTRDVVIDYEITARPYNEKHGKAVSTRTIKRNAMDALKAAHPEIAHTADWDEHPDGYNDPCLCRTCMEYAAQD